MAKPRKQWGDLSARSRDRATRQAAEDYGLTRKQARERYNRGTYKPFARDEAARIPKNSPRQPMTLDQLREAAVRNMDRHLGEYFSYNRFTVLDAIYNHASEGALRRIAGASEDELTAWASHNKKKRSYYPPKWIDGLGWYEDREWHNVFWYH